MMKRKIILLLLCAGLSLAPVQQTHAAAWWVIVVKKILKAMDLAVQQLQNKTIWLQNAQKALENTMSKLKLDEISEWSEKHREQYAKYFDELKKVKEVIEGYHKVKIILSQQAQLVEEYKKAIRLFRQDDNFSADELDYMEKVYAGIMEHSMKNLDQLYLVIRALSTQMTDQKRIEIIDRAAAGISQNLDDLRQFNTENISISLQRAKEKNNIEVIKKLYGL